MPFDNSSLNRIGSNLVDFNLRVTPLADIGKSLLIIGTASDGPVNVPVRTTELGGLSRAPEIFGDISQGTLLHTAFEANNANRRTKDIRLLRISNGNQAQLCFREVSISGELQYSEHEESYVTGTSPLEQFSNVLCLTAKYPGQIYNQVSVRAETGDGDEHPASQYVVIYNPKTKIESWFSYDYVSYDSDVDCHTVQDLADAINADPNLNTIILATVRELGATFELNASDPNDNRNSIGSYGISYDSNGYLKIKLSSILPVYWNNPSRSAISNVVVTGGAINVPTAGNLITSVNELYEVREYTQADAHLKGTSTVQLDYMPIKGVSTIPTETIIRYRQGSGSEYSLGQLVVHYHGLVIANVLDTGTLAFEFESETCPDDGYVASYYPNGAASMYRVRYATLGAGRSNVQLDGIPSTFHLMSTKNSLQQEVPSGHYSCAYDPSADLVTVTFLSGSYLPQIGSVLSCNYDSIIEDLSAESSTLTACIASNDWHRYFVSGKTLTFGKTLPGNASFRYRYKNILEEGADFIVSSSAGEKNDTILFTSLVTQPDLSGSMDTSGTIIGFNYGYQPEWIYLSSVQTLAGGTNGTNMDNLTKYGILADALEAIRDYPISYIVLADTYLDDVKTVYDPNTGVPIVTNAGFHTLLHNHLEQLTSSTSETVGIMSVKPASGNTPTEIQDWVTKLTKVDPSDPNRGANILASFGSKYMTLVAGELVFSNEAAYVPYAHTAEGLYSGFLSACPVNTSPSNKNLYGLSNIRYLLSGGENGQLDKLTRARLVTFRQKNNGDIAIVSGVTASPEGSDYQREMTRNTVFEAMNIIRLVCDPFLGEGNSPQIRAAMETAINSGLQKLVEMNPPPLQAYDFVIRSSAQDQVLGIVYIDLVLVPVFELREIRVTVKLRAEL